MTEEARLYSGSALSKQTHRVDPAFGGFSGNVGEPGTYSAIIVVEKDWSGGWQREIPPSVSVLLADCKSFRTEELPQA
ncbi:hypothetical protein AUH73_06015 [archaeon 13_1_40CM_4_53_4]|nr:MAG: hypothetical protein AUI07_08905 [archaeon 13_2_20CM_2_53_6]OLC61950.1 MAG: hypothetical protein AUH73_06015 [archaeon 13_1_40CM_4_53_4]OLE58554.1 MAG: hypothetical protein AUG17_07055 [Crenarchaeota archaeon 13_1_20CM_2_53_14]